MDYRRPYSDTADFTEIVSIAVSKAASDTVDISDLLSIYVNKGILETVNISEIFTKNIQKSILDVVNFSESVSKLLPPGSVAETSTFSDTYIIDYQKNVPEVLTFSESIAKDLSIVLLDTFAMSDQVAFSGTGQQIVNETGVFTDIFSYSLSKFIDVDTTNFSEIISKSLERVVSETVNITETTAKEVSAGKLDVVNVTETTAKTMSTPKEDIVNVTELTTKAIASSKSEIVSVSEILAKSTTTPKSDIVNVTDVYSLHPSKNVIEVVDVSETTAKNIGKLTSDNFNVSETIYRTIEKAILDTFTMSDIYASDWDYGGDGTEYNETPSETSSFSEIIAKALSRNIVTSANVSFFWRCESITLDSTHDYSVGAMTGTIMSSAAINTEAAIHGTNGLDCPTSSDRVEFTVSSGDLIDSSVGSLAFSFRLTLFEDASLIFYAYNSAVTNNRISVEMSGTETDPTLRELRFRVRNATGINHSIATTSADLEYGVIYSLVARWDEPNNSIRLEVYNSDGSLRASIENTSTNFDVPTDINTLAVGLNAGGNIHIDNVFISKSYSEPLQNYALYTSATQLNTVGEVVNISDMPIKTVSKSIERSADITLFWRCESTTLDPTHDFTLGVDTTWSAVNTVSLDASAAKVGSLGILGTDYNTYMGLDVDSSMIDLDRGSVGAWVRVHNPGIEYTPINLRGGSFADNVRILYSGGSGRARLAINQDGASPSELITPIGEGLTNDTWYFIVGRWDVNSNQRSIEVYDESLTLFTSNYSNVPFTRPLSVQSIRLGSAPNAKIDNFFLSKSYSEPLQNYALYTSATQLNAVGETVAFSEIPAKAVSKSVLGNPNLTFKWGCESTSFTSDDYSAGDNTPTAGGATLSSAWAKVGTSSVLVDGVGRDFEFDYANIIAISEGSMACWYRHISGGTEGIILNAHGVVSSNRIQLATSPSGAFQFNIRGSTNNYVTASGVTIQPNTTYGLVARWNASTMMRRLEVYDENLNLLTSAEITNEFPTLDPLTLFHVGDVGGYGGGPYYIDQPMVSSKYETPLQLYLNAPSYNDLLDETIFISEKFTKTLSKPSTDIVNVTEIPAKLFSKSIATFSDISFYWRCESATLDPTHDYSAGDTTAVGSTGARLSAAGAKLGTNGLEAYATDGYYSFTSTNIVSVFSGSVGFWFKYTTWVQGDAVFNCPFSEGYIQIQTGATQGTLQGKLRNTGYGDANVNTSTSPMLSNTWYFLVLRWDHTTDLLKIEVYNENLTLRESTQMALTWPPPLNDHTEFAFGTWEMRICVDNIFISQSYSEPLQNYALYTSATQLAPSDQIRFSEIRTANLQNYVDASYLASDYVGTNYTI